MTRIYRIPAELKERLEKEGVRLITRQQGNRRMWDHTRSDHTTLPELAVLVKTGVAFEVWDNGKGDPQDITRYVMLQILYHKERREPALTTAQLRHVIRYPVSVLA